MKAIIFSDSHRDFSSILRIMEKEEHVDYIIHAGDVQRDVDDMESMWPNIPCIYVLGNNDWSVFGVPLERTFTLEGKRIFLCHGHRFGVKQSLALLYKKGLEEKADLCIYGHTHVAHKEERGGITLFNPGAVYKSYGILTIQEGQMHLEIKETD